MESERKNPKTLSDTLRKLENLKLVNKGILSKSPPSKILLNPRRIRVRETINTPTLGF